MPHKSRNNSRNNSRKSTSSQTKATVVHNDEEYPSIKVVFVPKPSSKKSTPKTPRAEFQEPLVVSPPSPPTPPPSPWELMGLSEEEYSERVIRSRQRFEDDMKESYKQYLLADWDDPSYWDTRMKNLEKQRESFNKKRGWSALDCSYIDQLDAQIQECWDELDRIYSEEERLEYLYD